MTEWKSITSAPIDRPVLASWVTDKGYKVVGEAWYQIETLDVEGDLPSKFGLGRPVGFWSFDHDGTEPLAHYPTHWAELPEAPK